MLLDYQYPNGSRTSVFKDAFNSKAIRQVAETIANGHALKLHLDEFRDLQIKTRLQFADHLELVLTSDKTKSFSMLRNNDIDNEVYFFYHSPSNTVVVVPDNENHEPTAFRPAEGSGYYNSKLKSAKKQGFIL